MDPNGGYWSENWRERFKGILDLSPEVGKRNTAANLRAND